MKKIILVICGIIIILLFIVFSSAQKESYPEIFWYDNLYLNKMRSLTFSEEEALSMLKCSLDTSAYMKFQKENTWRDSCLSVSLIGNWYYFSTWNARKFEKRKAGYYVEGNTGEIVYIGGSAPMLDKRIGTSLYFYSPKAMTSSVVIENKWLQNTDSQRIPKS